MLKKNVPKELLQSISCCTWCAAQPRQTAAELQITYVLLGLGATCVPGAQLLPHCGYLGMHNPGQGCLRLYGDIHSGLMQCSQA